MISRRALLVAATGSATGAALLGSTRSRAASLTPLSFSFQASSVLFQILRTRGVLDANLAKLGFVPEWSELGRTIAQLGNVTFEGDVAEAVPPAVHPHLPNLIIYAAEGPSPHATGILVKADSPYRSVADLRGKRVAVGKGGSAYDLLLRGLEAHSLSIADIKPAYLAESAAVAAFRSGYVDAWSTFDPFLSVGEADPGTRLLLDGAGAGMNYDRYYMVDRDFAIAHPAVVQAVFDSLTAATEWINTHRAEADSLLSHLWQDMPLDTVRRINSHRTYAIRHVGSADLARLNDIAARLTRAGVLEAGAARGIRLWTPA